MRSCPPTALKMMRRVKDPRSRHDYRMRTIACGGETLGEELFDWGREVMGVEINEFYGQTEANLVVGNCGQVLPISRGSMGKPIPGHRVAVVDAEGNACPPDTVGEIAVRRPDPVMFLNYWRNPRATASKFVDALPLTNTGKIIRGELRRREVEKQR